MHAEAIQGFIYNTGKATFNGGFESFFVGNFRND